MFVDRDGDIVETNGVLQSAVSGRLNVFFSERDIDFLVDPTIGHIGDRFMGCTEEGTVVGWAPEDKIHIALKQPSSLEDDAKVAEVQVDFGGDLYFTIWSSSALRAYSPVEFLAEAPFVTNDPNGKLAQVGIQSFCLHQLVDLRREIASRVRP